jgi:TonB-dependent SusC/RagA subfamily outer membrane receptor
MKQALLLFILFISAVSYGQDYKSEWTKVMRNEASGEIKSAAAAVNQIYLLAKKDKNEPQLLKTFFFRAKYMQVLEEDALTKILNNLKSDKEIVSVPSKAIMESLYGQMLKHIYDRDSYKIRSRTNIDTTASSDFQTWTRTDYEYAIENAYRKSLENKAELEALPLEHFHPIIDFALPYTNSRPLYDFLLERYIEYRMMDGRDYFEHRIIEPQVHLLFGDTKEFSTVNIPDSIPGSVKESILLLMDIEKRYGQSNDTGNLRQAILRRLDILSKKLYYNKEREAYLVTVAQLAKEWQGSPYSYKAKVKQAALLYELADKNVHRDYLVNALSICEELIATSKEHNCGPEAEQIKSQILRKTFNIRTEKYLMPNKPSLANVAFENIDTLQLKIFKVGFNDIANINNNISLKNLVGGKKPLMTKSYYLPNKKDYFNRETEVVVPPLEKGSYVFCFSNFANMDEAAFVNVQVTGKSLIQQSLNDNRIYQLLDCVTGKPIKNAVATYSGKKVMSDSDGNFKIDEYHKNKSRQYLTHKVTFIHEGDTLTNSFTQYAYTPDDEDDIDINARITLYLDRAIYRPGQKMFFKGIVVQEKAGVYSTVSDIYVSVTIMGPSRNEIKKLRLKVNEFGSFTGECIIPAGGLTGEYTIQAQGDEEYDTGTGTNKFWGNDNLNFDDGYVEFSVEEYKRPTFQVKFDPVKEDIRINEKATVGGSALSFSGAPLSGATVKYRINRTSKSSMSMRYAEQVQIAIGEAVTDQEGKFKIDFTVLPDPALPKEDLPVFTYTIYADVEDIGGETQAGETRVLAGYHSLLLNATIPGVINAADKNFVTLSSQNLNGEPLPVKGEVIVYKLDSPAKILARRPLPVPEIQPLSEEEFIKLFPHLPYSNSQSIPKRGRSVFSAQVDTDINTILELTNAADWEPGKYELVFSAKDLGNPVQSIAEFSLTKDSDLLLPDNDVFQFEIINKDYLKDGYIEVTLRSSLPLLYINLNAYNKEKNILHELTTLKDGRKTIKIPLNKAVEGKVYLHLDFVWQNGFYHERDEIIIPDIKEKLEIETIAITDKLRPGSEQTWSFMVKSKDKLPSEVLASMYDASLDQFASESWDEPVSLDYYDGDNHYRQPLTYDITYAYFYSPIPYIEPIKTKDIIYTYGFSLANGGKTLLRYSPKQQLPGNGKIHITGTISDREGKPVSDAVLVVESTFEGVDANKDGQFSIYADPGDQLIISGTHFIEKRVDVSASGTLNVVLERASVLEEVKIDTYHRTTKSKSSAAVTTISIEAIEDRANASVLQNLQGQVAGLNIATGSGQPGAGTTIILRGVGTLNNATEPLFVIDGIPVDEDGFRSINQSDISSITILKDAAATSIYGNRGVNGVIVINTKNAAKELEALQNVQARRNFDETAFFYPQLLADKDGKISFTFTTPEALTEWKLRLLAHDKTGNSGYFQSTFLSQKDLMVVPNMPRFLRENDTIVITAKITNLTAEAKTGSALLQLADAMTMDSADSKMLNRENMKSFSISPKNSTTVSWKIAVPEGMQGVHYKIVAKAGDFTDGEENILPVLTNNMLVTESLPLWVKPNTTKEFTLENLKDNTSSTLRHHAITLEYTSNPAWLALQSLPYLMEFEHECAEQVFSRYYANAIASHILKSNPKIAEAFAGWKKDKPVSRLEQNEELKSVILAETPWLLDAKSEEDKKARLALLFEFDAMSNALTANFEKLYQKPGNNGGFPWFDGGNENEFITRHILAGFGHLNKLGITPSNKSKQESLQKRGVKFIDDKFLEHHTARVAHAKNNFRMWHYDDGLHYLYTRSFYLKEYPLNESVNSAVKLYLENIKANWKDYTLYQKGMAALTLNRFNDSETAKKIIRSLSETSSNNEEWGMYWIENKPGWYWSQAPVETQALLIEAFMEVNNDIASADAMKVWLIKNKQNKNWPTTKATTEAVYALLMQGSNWLAVEDKTTLKTGDTNLLLKKLEESKAEAESGYVKLNWKADEVSATMAKLTVSNGSAVPGYGGYYWQYFEDLDKIKPAQEGIMNVAKELYLKKNTASGQQLQKITSANPLKIGDLVTVRLVITTKEDMEYVHLKDLRAAAFEPVSVLSGYQWKDGLGFYQSTRDVATHFFFDKISKGTYVLEYDVRVNNAGEFSNGITTIQSMYAPEFSSHTKGIRVKSE